MPLKARGGSQSSATEVQEEESQDGQLSETLGSVFGWMLDRKSAEKPIFHLFWSCSLMFLGQIELPETFSDPGRVPIACGRWMPMLFFPTAPAPLAF